MSIAFPILPLHTSTDNDTLQYSVYPLSPDVNLRNILDYVLDLISTWTDSYIWNLDPFALQLDSSVPRLHGEMEMGEESRVSLDEWVVVAALWRASTRFPNVVIKYALVCLRWRRSH